MPRVLPWEQLSRYKGFKVVGVEAGLNASICMIVSHTQQVFELNAGTDTATQVRRMGRENEARSMKEVDVVG